MRNLPPPLLAEANGLMALALEEARRTPLVDVPVGAILLDATGRVLSRGHNEREFRGDATAHAEVEAIRAAGRPRLDDCTLVVTLEPCTMCAGAILGARVGRLIFGAWEPKTGACGSLIDVLRDPPNLHRPEVLAGIREEECAALMTEFFASRR
ncbi:MAG: nucleoside deaminase [Corynebacterium sp.]|nr:nucleoside deaminase [Corynebacterium sp.]